MDSESIDWFIKAIRRLPSDPPVARGTPGYNNYRTQKDHWLGWLDPDLSKGTYPRRVRPGDNARRVYNGIVEPKLLLWLISASGVESTLVAAAIAAVKEQSALASKSKAIRSIVPWPVVSAALSAYADLEAPSTVFKATTSSRMNLVDSY